MASRGKPLPVATVLEIHELYRTPLENGKQRSAYSVSKQLGLAHRTVSRYLNEPIRRNQEGALRFLSLEVPPKQVKSECEDMMPLTADGFELFFNKYSPWTLAKHSKMFVEQALTSRRVLLNVPPRFAKSKVFSVWMPLWLYARQPNGRDTRILLISKARDLALDFVREIADNLEFNQPLIDDFGRFKPDGAFSETLWRPRTGQLELFGRTKLRLVGDLNLQAQGAGTHIIGRGYDWIVCDDTVDLENSWTEEQRDKLWTWFNMELMSRRQPGARVVVIGTRAHEDDLYGRLSLKTISRTDETPLWKHINYPAVSDGDGNPTLNFEDGISLWPEQWPVNDSVEMEGGDEEYTSLEAIYRDLGESIFAQTYQQEPVPPSERLVRPEWIFGGKVEGQTFEGCLDHERPLGAQSDPPDGYVRVVSVDPAGTKFWAFTVADVRTGSQEFHCNILEAFRGKMDMRAFHDQMVRIAEDYSPTYWIQEINSAQKHFNSDEWAAWYKKTYSIRPLDHTTGRNKSDQELGVDVMAVDFEFARIRIPYAGDHTRRALADFIDELLAYPYGRTTDQVMSLWFIKNNHQKLWSPGSGKLQWGFRLPARMRRQSA